MPASQIQALLFDLGGVVVEIDFNRAFAHWQSISRLSLAELKAAFTFDVPYQRHERGEITANEYFVHLAQHLQLQDDPARIAEGWNSIFIAEITETLRMIETARAKLPCYAFTNTNAAHKAAWSVKFPAVVHAFDHIFVSSEIGHRKPDRSAFEFVAHSVGVPLESTLFFDDTLENVDGALAAGLEAVYVRRPEDVRTALRRLGCELGR
jgi:glucose-1-phosphatase